ncbi:hypothetical protein PFBG_06147 [Plasmodium falciparum 7G8]|uniref:Uncharacterized protein n=1 Tax=Plasmodium falciparum (isolate 7G8) TaxID=57266 RepID=W7F5J8_PLAF8|nr:hypothetical protein PFBG_06147 [Plasmodium falciparum 7G8]
MHNHVQHNSFTTTIMTLLITMVPLCSSTNFTSLNYYSRSLHFVLLFVISCTIMHNNVQLMLSIASFTLLQHHLSSFTTIITYIIIIVLLRSIIVFILPNYYYFHVLYCTYMHNNIQFKSTTTTILT